MVAAEKPTPKIDHTDESPTPYPPIETSLGEAAERRAIWQQAPAPLLRRRRPDTLWWTRRFAGTPDQVRAARRFVGTLLADGDNAEDAAWVAGELCTNAIRHSNSDLPGEWFEVEVVRTLSRAEICVTDAGGKGAPTIRDPEPQNADNGHMAECGRGLYGIGALATRYGSYLLGNGRRVVWVRLDVGRQAVVGTDV